MKFAIYHPWVYLRGGAERTILGLLNHSRHSWVVFTHHYDPETTFAEFGDHEVVQLTPRISVQRTFGHLVRAATAIARSRLPDVGAKGLLVSSESVGDFILLNNDLPSACYCLTPLKILHDPKTRAHLRASEPAKAAALAVMGPAFEVVERKLWTRYRHVWACSAEARARVIASRRAKADDVEVLHPGVDTQTFSFGEQPRDDFFLVPGRIVYWKNIELAIEAFKVARSKGIRSRLIVAGAVDEKSRPYLEKLKAMANGQPVDFDMDVSDARMAELMRRARAVIFPSWNEDFGIIPLEAMAAGTPVLALDAGGPRETVVDGSTGWLLPPDPETFAARMLTVENDDESIAKMRLAAREQAVSFSWERFAQRVDDVIERITA